MIEKTSFKTGEGDERFKHFFRLGSAILSIQERLPVVAALQGRDPREIVSEFLALEEKLGAFKKLSAFASALQVAPGAAAASRDALYLLVLDSRREKTSWIPFSRAQRSIAQELYATAELREKDNPDLDLVLASAADARTLRRAYPNYFADASVFIESLKSACRAIPAARH